MLTTAMRDERGTYKPDHRNIPGKNTESTTAAPQSVQETIGSGSSPVVNNSGSTGTSGSLQQGESYGPGNEHGHIRRNFFGKQLRQYRSQGVSLEGPGSTVSSTISQRKVITTALPEVEYGREWMHPRLPMTIPVRQTHLRYRPGRLMWISS